ncbi:hypothetical protein CLOM_g13132 [Closterium sp. NIES-68]|nr:hypothetical protein CLOM_g13132 [Closterium sp. NIES-68]
MDQVLKAVPATACYIDDVVIFSKIEEEHAEHLKATLDAIVATGLTCHPEKCKIARRTLAYVGLEKQIMFIRGEGLAAVWGVTHFRAYLQGQRFMLVTDHQPLLWLITNQTLTGRNTRWAMRLQEYDFVIKHCSGKTLQHADGLSRNPPPEVEQLWAAAAVVPDQGAVGEWSGGRGGIGRRGTGSGGGEVDGEEGEEEVEGEERRDEEAGMEEEGREEGGGGGEEERRDEEAGTEEEGREERGRMRKRGGMWKRGVVTKTG